MPKYIVMTSSAKMPTKVKSAYRNVAVVELEDGFTGKPTMISERAKGIVRIVHHFGPQNVGKAKHSAYVRAMRDAETMAATLNAAV